MRQVSVAGGQGVLEQRQGVIREIQGSSGIDKAAKPIRDVSGMEERNHPQNTLRTDPIEFLCCVRILQKNRTMEAVSACICAYTHMHTYVCVYIFICIHIYSYIHVHI